MVPERTRTADLGSRGRWHCHLGDGDHVLSLSGTSKILKTDTARDGRYHRRLAMGWASEDTVQIWVMFSEPLRTRVMSVVRIFAQNFIGGGFRVYSRQSLDFLRVCTFF